MFLRNKIAILGAGISGISAAYHIQKKYSNSNHVVIYEKTNDWGGLCGGFYVSSPKGRFWFDHAVHLSFTSNHYVQQIFHTSSTPLRHAPFAVNYSNGVWLKHPAQNNLFPLNIQEKILILKDMINNKNQKNDIYNFEQWLRAQFGNYFAENFPMKYTRKYWTTEAKNLSTSWLGTRFYTPSLEEILRGAMNGDTPNTYYAQEMRYPKEGQYRSFLKLLVSQVNIAYNKEIVKIDTCSKTLLFSDGTHETYSTLISTLPIPILVKMISNTPDKILEAASHLKSTSIALVSLGFSTTNIPKHLWFYIYDEDKLFARVYSPSIKSPKNVPKNCSSLQAEIYFSDFKKLGDLTNHALNVQSFCVEHVINSLVTMGICSRKDIVCSDFRIIRHANVIFTHDMEKYRRQVLDYIEDKQIFSCGRFGKWDYLWSDQSFLSGKSIVEKIRL